jgi:Na+-translocating ferredoxin:NAD+ oxidoreductase RNF subunit RnfB
MEKGRNLIRQNINFLKKFMAEQGYHSLYEIIGLGQQYIKYNDEVDTSVGKVIAVIDEAKCTKCGVCVDNLCVARYWKDGEIKVIEDNCVGCGCCMIGCTADAIKLVKVA